MPNRQQQLRRGHLHGKLSTPYYVSSAVITSIKEMPLLSPLPLLLFGVFQLWKDLLQCFEI